MLLKISQNSQENTCARVSFLSRVTDNTNSESKDGLDLAIEKFKDHPSIKRLKMINENFCFESRFSFKDVSETNVEKEISNLNSKKAGTLGNIPTKVLKDSSEIWNIVLKNIWNYEMLGTQYLKLAGIYADT